MCPQKRDTERERDRIVSDKGEEEIDMNLYAPWREGETILFDP